MTRTILAALGLSLALLTPALARADEAAAPLSGRLRLHVDTSLLGFDRRGDSDPEAADDPRTNTLTFGFGRPRDAGLVQPLVGFGVGYAWRRVVLGANLGLVGDRQREAEDASATDDFRTTVGTLGGALIPYLNVLLLPERRRLLPWVGARFGFTGAAVTAREQGITPISGIEVRNLWRDAYITPLVGVGVGAHVMLAPRVSFDFAATFDYSWGFYRRRTELSLSPAESDVGEWEPDRKGWGLALLAGLSMWL
ncbi:MAG: hypothetical protein R3A79_10475 [Nannocystaceae bacterium]